MIVNGQLVLPMWSSTQLATFGDRVQALAAALRARAVVPLSEAFDPRSGTDWGPPPGALPAPGGKGLGAGQQALPTPSAYVVPVSLGVVTVATKGDRSGYNVSDSTPLYVATPALLRRYGTSESAIDPNTDIITSRRGLRDHTVVAPRSNPMARSDRASHPQPTQWRPTTQQFDLPTFTSDPTTLLTPHALESFGLRTVPAGWLVDLPHALTAAQVTAAEHAAAEVGLSVETRTSERSLKQLRDDATIIGILVALGVLTMTVGLIRSETANDLRTLTAAGASTATRRNITAATAGALAFLGALLGIAVAYLALVAWYSSNLQPLTNVPVADLAIVLFALPALAAGGGWLLAGREPPDIAHQPLE
jgi:putative ABC transport system permease protein